MVEDLDNIKLTNDERLAVAVFFAYMSRKTDEIIADPKHKIRNVRALATDWYTSVTSSNILWIKDELRKDRTVTGVRMSMDINSLSGSIAIGNMCKFVPCVQDRADPDDRGD